MLKRGPAYSRYATRTGNRFSWQQEGARAAAYDEDVEEEMDETSPAYDEEASGYDAEDVAADDSYDDADDLYPPAFKNNADEEEAYQAEDDYSAEDDESGAQDEQQWDDQEQWDETQDDEAEDDEHALVPFENRPMPVLRGPNVTLPLFIAGRDRAARPGTLGHTPLTLRASRPRPFFMHAFAVGAVLMSLLAAAFALAPLSVKQDMLTAFRSLANSAAPPTATVAFHWYSVHYGDTLGSIASHFGVHAGGILELNQLESADQLYIGMNVKIPNDSSYGSNFHALLNIPMTPATIPPPPYGNWVIPPGFDSFGVQDYYGDPWAGAFGQCTWWAHHKRPDENFVGFGDAWNWANAALAKGMRVTATPLPNATVVFAPGAEGALGLGHVAHVEQILSDGWVLISEMNFFWNGGGYARVDYRYITAAPGVWFIA